MVDTGGVREHDAAGKTYTSILPHESLKTLDIRVKGKLIQFHRRKARLIRRLHGKAEAVKSFMQVPSASMMQLVHAHVSKLPHIRNKHTCRFWRLSSLILGALSMNLIMPISPANEFGGKCG